MGKEKGLHLRWLGVAGLELIRGDDTLIVDPYLSRIPFFKMFFTRVLPDARLTEKHIKVCSYILVTHAHIDHVFDVPEIIRQTGCTAYGSYNTCRILSCCGVDDKRIKKIDIGDKFSLGEFKVEVLKSIHRKLSGFNPGKIKGPLKAPLKARQYLMDSAFSFHISSGGISLLTDPGVSNKAENMRKSDLLLIGVTYTEKYLRTIIGRIMPKVIIPIHWDDIFRPLSLPARPFFRPPSRRSPFLKRIDLNDFLILVKRIDPRIKVLVPEILRSYQVKNFLTDR